MKPALEIFRHRFQSLYSCKSQRKQASKSCSCIKFCMEKITSFILVFYVKDVAT